MTNSYESDSSDDQEKENHYIKIDINLGLNAHTNARYYYEMKKSNKVKLEKTKAAVNEVFFLKTFFIS